MIATLTVIVYILSVSEENYTNNNVQKGVAISRIDNQDGYQSYNFTAYISSSDSNDSDSEDGTELVQSLMEGKVYLITAKFAFLSDTTLSITLTTSLRLDDIDKNNLPISKPIAHMVGKTTSNANVSETGYTLALQVKPYLSKEQFNAFTVLLTHPPNGRFRNAITTAKKNSTIHATGVLFLVKNQLYCELLEFQFITTKTENGRGGIVVPWKTETKTSTEGNSEIDRRIATISECTPTDQPQLTPTTKTRKKSTSKGKPKANTMKINEIAASLMHHSSEPENENDQNDASPHVSESDHSAQEETSSAAAKRPRRTPKRRKFD